MKNSSDPIFAIRGKIKFGEPLNKHTTFRIGGPAYLFIEPRSCADLRSAVSLAKKYKIPVLVIGAGSNILAGDKGIEAVVLHLNSVFFKKAYFKGNRLEVSCGLSLGRLIKLAQEHSLSGAEFLTGIPGTVGGALAMNAGAWGKTIGDLVESARVMDYEGRVKTLNKPDIRFGYRQSSLKDYIILNAGLRFVKKDKEAIKEEIDKYRQLRSNAQDNSLPNAGCVFRNPANISAGRLIDLCGLKGKSKGDAFVSMKHANFILNRGRGRAADVLGLMGLIKKRVNKKFGIDLEPEIKIWQ